MECKLILIAILIATDTDSDGYIIKMACLLHSWTIIILNIIVHLNLYIYSGVKLIKYKWWFQKVYYVVGKMHKKKRNLL